MKIILKILKYLISSLIILSLLIFIVIYLNRNYEYILDPVKKVLPENIKTLIKSNVIFLPKAIISSITDEREILKLYARMEKLKIIKNEAEQERNSLKIEIIKLQQEKDRINEKFFPKTQFIELKYNEVSLKNFIYNKSNENRKLPYFKRDGKDVFSFYLSSKGNNIIITDKSGVTNYTNFSSLEDFKLIDNNLPEYIHVTDTLLIKNDFYVALSHTQKDCGNFYIYKSKLNFKKLDFELLLFNEPVNGEICQDTNGGRLEYDQTENDLYFTSYDYNIDKLNLPNQNVSKDYKYSAVSKINLDTKKVEIISLGHRNPQGLLITSDNFILSTEHGPRGGDEINKILKGKNYGWPEASYGERYRYGFFESESNFFKKDHRKYGFEEPIFSFVPSIGISQIIELENSFSKKWIDNYIVSSLRGHSIYRIKFNEKYDKILFMERMRIGKRIRDIAYNKKNKAILLALEDGKGSLGVIYNKNN